MKKPVKTYSLQASNEGLKSPPALHFRLVGKLGMVLDPTPNIAFPLDGNPNSQARSSFDWRILA
jgi:hypothetical protein